MTIRRFSIKCSPYAERLEVCIGSSGEASPWLEKAGCDVSDLDTHLALTLVPDDADSAPIRLWLSDPSDKPTLVHEIIHVAFAVLHRAGVPISYENDEAVAYLVGHILEAVEKRLAAKPRAPRRKKSPPSEIVVAEPKAKG